jgi:hypothetical protein
MQKCKKIKNKKMQATQRKKTPRIIPASIALAHPDKCGFSQQTASCGHLKNALMALPAVFA